jgi:hypothetical protein
MISRMSIKNPKQKVQHHLAKMNYNYYFDETAFPAILFQFNRLSLMYEEEILMM